MAELAGKGGAVYVGSNKAASVSEWSISLENDNEEITDFSSSGWKEFLATLSGWSGSISGRLDVADTAQMDLLNAANIGSSPSVTTVTLKLYIDESGTKYYTGSAYITGVDIDTNVDGVVEGSFDFQGTGQLTYATS